MSSRLLKAYETMPGIPTRIMASLREASEAPAEKAMPPDILALSRQRAEAIIQEALEGASRIAARAHDEGYAAGRAEGYNAGLMEAQSLVSEANQRLNSLEQERAKLMVQAEQDVARLATRIASLIIKREIKADPEAVLGLVRDGLMRVRDEGAVTVRLNPLDAVVVRGNMSRLINGSNVRQMQIEEDNAMEQAGCLVSTSRGDIDERVESQLRRITSVLESVERDGNA